MGLRKVAELSNASTGVVCKVFKDSEWEEYRARFYRGGQLVEAEDYHTDDKEDAIGTARFTTS
jgi:hypothetical protein